MSNTQTNWQPAPTQPTLSTNQVEVWRARLDMPEARVKELATLLSIDEAERAARFKFEEHRHRYIVGRGTLRIILARYLETSPASIEFGYTQQTKPYLPNNDLCFNLSHSGEMAVYALTRGKRIGVDIELVRPLADFDQMAEHYFAAGEIKVYQNLPEAQKIEGFYNCWTRKEAFVKAIGDGLTTPLDRFEVSLAPGELARLVTVQDTPSEAKRWTLDAFTPEDGYVGAVAVEAREVKMRWWETEEMLGGSGIE